MLFRKYHIVIFKDRLGSCRKLQVRGWVIFTFFLLTAALVAGNIYFWNFFGGHSRLEKSLSHSEKTIQEQKTQLTSLSEKIENLQKDLTRIRNFDSKLRVMINLDQDGGQIIAPKGGKADTDFAKGYLPLYRQELLARKMHNFLKQLNVEAKLEEVSQKEIIQTLRGSEEILQYTPTTWPTSGWITSPFGWRTSPFTGKREFHKGIDISTPKGTPIYAPANGKILHTGRDEAFGLNVKIIHNNSLSTRFAHMQRIAIKSGQNISRGDIIGYVGETGRTTGPHLHYEVRLNGVPVNPMRYILN